MKRAQFGPHDWLSLSVPPGPSWLLVDSLEPETAYQFSVLAQNRLGTSAFSEVVTVNTLGEVLGWCVWGLFLSRADLDKGDASDSLRINIRPWQETLLRWMEVMSPAPFLPRGWQV